MDAGEGEKVFTGIDVSKDEKKPDKMHGICEREKIKIHFSEVLDD